MQNYVFGEQKPTVALEYTEGKIKTTSLDKKGASKQIKIKQNGVCICTAAAFAAAIFLSAMRSSFRTILCE